MPVPMELDDEEFSAMYEKAAGNKDELFKLIQRGLKRQKANADAAEPAAAVVAPAAAGRAAARPAAPPAPAQENG